MQVNESYVDIFSRLKRYNYVYGGSSSAKTYSIVQHIVLRMLKGEACVVGRASQTSIKKTIWNDFKEIINNAGLSDFFEYRNSSPIRIITKYGTGECLFLGLDKNADDAKGLKPSNGAGKFTLVFLDECDQIPKNALMQMRLRIRGISDFDTNFIYSFNPTFLHHYLFQDLILPKGFDPYNDYMYEDDDTLIARMTYKDNAFLEQSDIDELESIGRSSEYHAQVYLRAEPGNLGKRCISLFETINEGQVPKVLQNLIGGIDHGFNDPMACTWGMMDERNNTLYIIGELYGSEMDLGYAADNLPRNVHYTGDSEDPRSNATLRSKGVHVSDAKKGPGSVFGGIMYLNTLKIKVLDTCVNTIMGLQNYSWKVDRISGHATDEPEHAYSHGPDSIRYMVERFSRGSLSIRGAKYKI